MSAKKLSIKLTLALFVIFIFSANCANAQITANQDPPKDELPLNADFSTDQAVIDVFQKRIDAKRAELGMKSDDKLKPKDICIERLKESAKVIVIGFFRYDYGCHFEGAFVDSRYLEETDATLSKAALNALGWEKANQTQRETLAKLWVEKGLLAFSIVLYTKDKDFNNGEFQPPNVVSKENGEVVVTLWTWVMRRKKEFNQHEFKFAKDGNLLK